ncbi:putative mitochondrial protein [Glycine soja]
MGRLVVMQSYPPRVLDRRLQETWARATKEGPRVLMNLRAHLGGEALSSMAYSLVDGASSHLFSFVFRCISMLKDPASIEAPQASFHQVFLLPFVFKPPTRKNHNLGTNMSHHLSSVNGKGTSHKDPLSRILDELSSLKLWKEKQERKEKGKKRVEEISQDERKKIREEEIRKIMKEMKREKHVSYSSHNSCKSLSEELRDYYEGRHRSHLRPHSHRREKERKPQEANINLSYFHGKDNVEANLDWEIRVEQQLKKKSTSKSYSSHSYLKKDHGQGILGVTSSKSKDDKGKEIEKLAPKASMQEKTNSINSQDKATTSPSSSEGEEAKGEEFSEEIYPQEDGQPLVVKEKCKEVSVSSKRHQIPTIRDMMNLLSVATLFCKIHHAPNVFMIHVHRDSLGRFVLIFGFNTNLGAHMRHVRNNQHKNTEKGTFYCITFLNFSNSGQGVPTDPKRIKVILDLPTPPSIREIWGCHDLTNFYKRFVPYFSILVAPHIELVRNHVPSWEDVHERSVEGRSPEYEESQDLRSNPFQGGGHDAILPPKGGFGA